MCYVLNGVALNCNRRGTWRFYSSLFFHRNNHCRNRVDSCTIHKLNVHDKSDCIRHNASTYIAYAAHTHTPIPNGLSHTFLALYTDFHSLIWGGYIYLYVGMCHVMKQCGVSMFSSLPCAPCKNRSFCRSCRFNSLRCDSHSLLMFYSAVAFSIYE